MQRPSLFQLCLRVIKQKSFYSAYHSTFDIKKADTDELRDMAYRLRYRVYRLEYGRAASLHYDDAVDCDLYDQRAVSYLLFHKHNGDLVGTMRVIVPDPDNNERCFPLQNICDHPCIHVNGRVQSLCEMASFCVAPQYRRRPDDGRFLPAYHDQDWRVQFREGRLAYLRRRIPYAPLGLFSAAFESVLDAKRLECIMMIEPDHLRSLEQIGLVFRVLGPKIEQYGMLLQPIIFNIKHSLDHMINQSPHCWDVVSDRGRLHQKANTLYLGNWEEAVFDEACRAEIYKKFLQN